MSDNTKDGNPKDGVASTKAPFDLMPSTARLAGNMAFHEGALKYGRHNWRGTGVLASVYYGALNRHMEAWWDGGEDIDPKSGLHHLWKMLACVAILIDAEAMNYLRDDRPPSSNITKMMEDVEAVMAENIERYGHINPRHYYIGDNVKG